MSTYLNIPTDGGQKYFNLTVTLEGVDFLLTFYWSTRESCYRMTITDTSGDDLATGVKLVSGWPLLQKWATTGLPAGELIVQSNGSDDGPAQLGQLGINAPWTLTYLPSDLLP